MIRFYRQQVFRLLTTLIFFRDRLERLDSDPNKVEGDAIRKYMSNRYYEGREDGDPRRRREDGENDGDDRGEIERGVITDIIDNDLGEHFEFKVKDLIEDLEDLVDASFGREFADKDQDFVETMIELLQNQRSANVISGKTLDQLRKAVLLPEELKKFKKVLQENPLSCSLCGNEFMGGEMATVWQEPGSPRTIICTKCRVPSVMTCSIQKYDKNGLKMNCHSKVEILPQLRKRLEKLTTECQLCAKEKKEAEQEAQRALNQVLEPQVANLNQPAEIIEPGDPNNIPRIIMNEGGELGADILLDPPVPQPFPAEPGPGRADRPMEIDGRRAPANDAGVARTHTQPAEPLAGGIAEQGGLGQNPEDGLNRLREAARNHVRVLDQARADREADRIRLWGRPRPAVAPVPVDPAAFEAGRQWVREEFLLGPDGDEPGRPRQE